MEDSDLIARIYPFLDIDFNHAVDVIEDTQQSMPPKYTQQNPTSLSRSNRESTEPPQVFPDRLDELPYLELRFSRGPRNSAGFVFGTGSTSNFVLPAKWGISRRHFSITYKNEFDDGRYRLILRDLGSTYGTAVGYDTYGLLEVRSRFDWIIHGYQAQNTTKNIVIRLHERLKFKIVVNQHDITSPAYMDNVERFRRDVAATEDLFGGLGLNTGPGTLQDGSMRSPPTNQIIIPHRVLAEGTCGTIRLCWNVSTGHEYACKQPVQGEYDKSIWENEVKIMKDLSHENIVKILYCTDVPVPLIYMEYMPYGDLKDAHRSIPFSYNECAIILHQSASALGYLHGRSVPIAHRDIKPDNILVQSRCPLHVKLCDFGLSKAGGILGTFCGTPEYCAPEVQDGKVVQKYTLAADIWSLGVVVLWLIWGFPSEIDGDEDSRGWCERLVMQVNDATDSRELANVLRHMVVIQPTGRLSATDCVRSSLQLIKQPQGGAGRSGLAPAEQGGGHCELLHGAPYPPSQPHPEPHLLENQKGRPIQTSVSEVRFLQWNEDRIAYWPSTGTINISHLCKVGNVSSPRKAKFLSRNRNIHRTVLRGGARSGTYLSLSDALLFCQHFELPQEPIRQLMPRPINSTGVSHYQGSPSA
ncbi:kinase-like domain-containing protein [Nemania sp. FL0031]|nr:kinase-like domain-containing protein [Nemania sp. FL0031]